MFRLRLVLAVSIAFCSSVKAPAQDFSSGNPGCANMTASRCVDLALAAMGGRERLQHIGSVRLQVIGHTALAEQSYRQDPFITSYERGQVAYDLANQRVLTESKLTWPESDPGQSDSDSVVVVGPDGGVTRSQDGDSPCGLGALDEAHEMLALGPLRLLLTASAATDLHFAAPESLRSTLHSVLVFSWKDIPVRIFLNQHNHLPDAVETTRTFRDFWYFWGDVRQRIYLDNWQTFRGIVYPTNLIYERNGVLWRSMQALKVEFDVPFDEKTFAMDANVARKSASSPGWNRPFRAGQSTALAQGVDLFPGAWNSTIVKQPDGVFILEAPISESYTQGVVKEARKRYPGAPIKAVLSTSDSWPHHGGVRFAVASGLPVYILDLNQPLLDKVLKAPHTMQPDALERTQSKAPQWRIVTEKLQLGNADNRMELYPLRGASTERQYMVYFPESHLLYASDTLALNDDGSLYDPELMREVAQAVTRENLRVDTVFAMHQGPLPWSQVLALLKKSE